eukprot:Lankesteria_metandrocarpae@DN2839_c1_g1_i1.p2
MQSVKQSVTTMCAMLESDTVERSNFFVTAAATTAAVEAAVRDTSTALKAAYAVALPQPTTYATTTTATASDVVHTAAAAPVAVHTATVVPATTVATTATSATVRNTTTVTLDSPFARQVQYMSSPLCRAIGAGPVPTATAILPLPPMYSALI